MLAREFNLRIIAGRWKGRRLLAVKGMHTRPTSDRVKEAIFNILQRCIEGANVLDLFAGTGNLGLEALSRGCARVVFVEKDPRAVDVLNKNRASLGCTEQTAVIRDDVFHAIKRLSCQERFDIIFADPPYGKGLETPLLNAIAENDVLCQDGVVILEHSSRDPQPDRVGNLVKLQDRRYGNTEISFYKKE
ncbi:16S rRNA (guanine(966)-N(2))-methyltransferase RsmD [Caldicoprobacter guelmensis]|uniref:16S rRNA (guanine(966)-N(2))-methyltransferase RsmD n=1 Tax=Caldicoprobacter guelmensis TaxID=1170224 RepID=UPI003742BCA4